MVVRAALLRDHEHHSQETTAQQDDMLSPPDTDGNQTAFAVEIEWRMVRLGPVGGV